MTTLSPKQRQVLEAILCSLRQRGMPPILDEIAEAIGVTSRFGAFRHVRALEHKGYIRRLPGPRGIQVLKDPAGNPLPPEEQVGYLPVYDRVTAGPPVLAREEVVDYVPVPALWLGGGEGFAVRVASDSMAPTVTPGDIAVVRRQPVAAPGDIVVALFGEEAVLKRFQREGGTVLLISDNLAYTPLRFPQGKNIKVLGKVVGLLRRFNGSTASKEQLHRV
ncbi:MAG: transcriptional repressor LexA [Candidatus Methylomirabilales bacterium]